jgi:hypothetical protein
MESGCETVYTYQGPFINAPRIFMIPGNSMGSNPCAHFFKMILHLEAHKRNQRKIVTDNLYCGAYS